jgi:hypothetical protein
MEFHKARTEAAEAAEAADKATKRAAREARRADKEAAGKDAWRSALNDEDPSKPYSDEDLNRGYESPGW